MTYISVTQYAEQNKCTRQNVLKKLKRGTLKGKKSETRGLLSCQILKITNMDKEEKQPRDYDKEIVELGMELTDEPFSMITFVNDGEGVGGINKGSEEKKT